MMSSGAHELRRFTADEFLQMIAAGIFADDRVELVDGEILTATPQGPEHISRKDEHRERLREAYGAANVHLRDQGPLRCGDHALPEPDLAVVKGKPQDYRHEHPSGSDTVLVVEEAKSSQVRDRRKAADYARGSVAVYWLLDLEAKTLEIYTRPDRERARYRSVVTLGEGDRVEIPDTDVTWDVASLFA